MKAGMTLTPDEAIALRRFAKQHGLTLDDAAHLALREFLISAGLLELPFDLDEETETQGSC